MSSDLNETDIPCCDAGVPPDADPNYGNSNHDNANDSGFNDSDFDYCIVGGGVVGLAIAYQLSDQGSVLLLERHGLFGSETSSRNSEVIHAGLYYPSGSLKERLCLRGKALLYNFCKTFDVPHQRCGKLIVAQQINSPQLRQLENKARALNIAVERWNKQQILQQEPAVCAEEALYSPTTGIIDSHAYMQALAQQAERKGALLMRHTCFELATWQAPVWQLQLQSEQQSFNIRCRFLINAGGLSAQQIARGSQLDSRLIPPLYRCRGHYFSYSGRNPFQHLIYPLPEANLAGLGIHATLDLGGQLRFGPDTQYLNENQHGYDVSETLRSGFATAISRYFPKLDANKLHPDYSGIRPKLHQAHETTADFLLQSDPQKPALHLFGIESPGLTASLAIAEEVARKVTISK